MKVAIIGGGISGLMTALHLEGLCEYTLFEKADYIGGHTHTHDVVIDEKNYRVDTGFIVCNRAVYKNFYNMLDKFEIQTQKSDMSFAVNNLQSGLIYNATDLPSMFCQKKNLLNPKFYRMIYDILRFYKSSEKILESGTQISLYDYLKENNYSQYFIDEHLLPMASALWSGNFESIKKFPIRYMLSFMKNHQMLQVDKRPTWETIVGGSDVYVKKLLSNLTGTFKANAPVTKVMRNAEKVTIHSLGVNHDFDYVFFACHSNQAIKMMEHVSDDENQILSNIPYVSNTVDLHTDASIMPENKKAWASWCVNQYPKSANKDNYCTVNYYMNLLQNINCPKPLIVSLNQSDQISDEHKLKTLNYDHPVYTNETLLAQSQKKLIQGTNKSYYVGAYWGWGFHEDGAKSALDAVNQFKKEVLVS